MEAKTLSKIFKIVCSVGMVTSAVLKWVGVMPSASIGEICALWAAVYGVGAGTIDANIIIDKFKGEAE